MRSVRTHNFMVNKFCKSDGTVQYKPACLSVMSCHLSGRRDKGHLILKRLFGVFNFFQKMNENKSTCGIIVVKSNSFVCFLEQSLTSKIITPLSDHYKAHFTWQFWSNFGDFCILLKGQSSL